MLLGRSLIGGRLLLAGMLVGSLAACGRGRDPGTVSCTPGERLLVGCAAACGVGACSGDPVLRVCDGDVDARACADAIAILGEGDDACDSLCPSARVTCPASGHVTVVHRAYRDGAYACQWDVQRAPAGEPLSSPDGG